MKNGQDFYHFLIHRTFLRILGVQICVSKHLCAINSHNFTQTYLDFVHRCSSGTDTTRGTISFLSLTTSLLSDDLNSGSFFPSTPLSQLYFFLIIIFYYLNLLVCFINCIQVLTRNDKSLHFNISWFLVQLVGYVADIPNMIFFFNSMMSLKCIQQYKISLKCVWACIEFFGIYLCHR